VSASRWVAAGLIAAALVGPARAAGPVLPSDGWASWDIPVDNVAAWCCFSSKNHGNAPHSCKLDGHDDNFGTRDDERTDTITVYARTAAGKVDRLRVLSATCPVEAQTPIQGLQGVAADDSARWLIAQSAEKPLIENALAALSVHPGDVARNGLVSIGNGDARAEVRSKAWFWLAIAGGPGAETPISAAVRKDPDDGVREQAVFALSQLPDERATQALIAIAEDRSLSREQRKRAVFWLSQQESGAALAYLDKILAASASR
jgi:hypothetical protein